MRDLEYQYYVNNHKNPLVRYGAKCFSQSDEDGITLEILKRATLNYRAHNYLEIGVGNGTECNTLILAALGWKGQWIGNEDIVVAHPNFTKAYVTIDNVVDLINVKPDLISIDIDGNDWHIVQRLLQRGIYPDIWILEYNAKFPPPVQWVMPYNEEHIWQGNDYFGASLESYYQLLKDYYTPVACNAGSGGNVYFVHREMYTGKPLLPEDVYVPPRYNTPSGQHPTSIKTINTFL